MATQPPVRGLAARGSYLQPLVRWRSSKHWIEAVAVVALAVLLSSCSRNPALRAFAREPIYAKAFTGFALVDALTGATIASQRADHLFTPASNTKIFTLATALAWLPPDSLPVLAYRYDGDTLRLWALAYPTLGLDDFASARRLQHLLRGWPGPVGISLHGYGALPRFGEGWMWDDFATTYMPEQSGLPVYGNLIQVWRQDSQLVTRPKFLVARAEGVLPKGVITRGESNNRLYVSAQLSVGDTLTIPLYAASALALQQLEDWTGRSLRYHAEPLPLDWGTRVWRGQTRDSLLRKMMWDSDNFLAEQLLLSAGLVARDLTQPSEIRRQAMRDILELDQQELRWADASGLSHYNLVSPNALTQVLVRLAQQAGMPALTTLFPAGGASGTIRDWYAGESGQPFVYAKTGSLRHQHCLSGYLLTRTGRWLAFSFMHNHFVGSSNDYKAAMQRTLSAIRDAY